MNTDTAYKTMCMFNPYQLPEVYCLNVESNRLQTVPYQVETQYLQIFASQIRNYESTLTHSPQLKDHFSGQSTSMLKVCIYVCFIWKILPLVMEDHGSFDNFFRNIPRWKKVACMYSDLRIVRFHLVRQNYESTLTSNRLTSNS